MAYPTFLHEKRSELQQNTGGIAYTNSIKYKYCTGTVLVLVF
jgi:hypothetical protein